MFKCNECGAEYKIKPDFCDCGNDEFSEILSNKQNIQKVSVFNKDNISPLALIFFILCLVLSILILLFFANPKNNNETNTTKNILKNEQKNIPNIDTFWNNTPVVKEQKNIENQPQQEIVEIVQIIEKPQKTSKNITPKQQTQYKTNTQQINKTSQQKINKAVQQPQNKTTNTTNSREIYNYKIRLRNALFSHLQAGAIQGKGKCGIEFAVNQNGKLINRAFTFQSDNKSLNDEVYKMMMRMPTFSPPPTGYKGELIKITFDFDNGNYEVHLVN